MTANVAQAITDPHTWHKTLRGAYEALRPGGHLVFETRAPARRAWEEWTRENSYRVTEIPGVSSVESWVQLIEVSLPLVTFRWTYVFAADRQVLTSDSTLRFREREDVEQDLVAHGYVVEDVRDAPDRPGRARLPGTTSVISNDPHHLNLRCPSPMSPRRGWSASTSTPPARAATTAPSSSTSRPAAPSICCRTGRRPAWRPGSPNGRALRSSAATVRRSSPKAPPPAPRRPSRSRTGGTSGTT